MARINVHQALANLVIWLTTGEGAGHIILCKYLVSIDKEFQKLLDEHRDSRAPRVHGLARIRSHLHRNVQRASPLPQEQQDPTRTV